MAGVRDYIKNNMPMTNSLIDLYGNYTNPVSVFSRAVKGKLYNTNNRSDAVSQAMANTPTIDSKQYYDKNQIQPQQVNANTRNVVTPTAVQQTPVVQATSKTASGKTDKSKVGQLLPPPAMVPATNDTATSASAVGQVVGDAPYQMSNLPIGSGVNQDLYGAEFNNANRYAGYGEASTGGDIVPPPVTGNAQDTFWENLNRAGGYSAQDWNAMTPEERIKAGALKSNLGSGMEQFGQLASGASALAGIYGTMQNAKYLKDQTKMQKAMIRADDANKSAFAKAAGGTYERTGV